MRPIAAGYRFDELITELSNIQEFVTWGMTCRAKRVSDIYCEEIILDCDPLRSINEIINSKYASCLEFSVIMKQVCDELGIPNKQCVIPRAPAWAMHGVVVVYNHVISMGNFIRITDVNEYESLVEMKIMPGDLRQEVYKRMAAASGSLFEKQEAV